MGSASHLHMSHKFANNSKNIFKVINCLNVCSQKHFSEQGHCSLPLCNRLPFSSGSRSSMVTGNKDFLAPRELVIAGEDSQCLCCQKLLWVRHGQEDLRCETEKQATGYKDELLQYVASHSCFLISGCFISKPGIQWLKSKGGKEETVALWILRSPVSLFSSFFTVLLCIGGSGTYKRCGLLGGHGMWRLP